MFCSIFSSRTTTTTTKNGFLFYSYNEQKKKYVIYRFEFSACINLLFLRKSSFETYVQVDYFFLLFHVSIVCFHIYSTFARNRLKKKYIERKFIFILSSIDINHIKKKCLSVCLICIFLSDFLHLNISFNFRFICFFFVCVLNKRASIFLSRGFVDFLIDCLRCTFQFKKKIEKETFFLI